MGTNTGGKEGQGLLKGYSNIQGDHLARKSVKRNPIWNKSASLDHVRGDRLGTLELGTTSRSLLSVKAKVNYLY